MAACGSLQHIFEKPFPENPTFLESLSQQWSQIKSNPSSTMKQDHSSSFTEIFGELHFKENSAEKGSFFSNNSNYSSARSHKNCTEGLGFESSDEVEDISAMDTNTDTDTFIAHDTPDCIVNNDWRRLEVVNDDGERELIDRKSAGRKPRAVLRGGQGFPPPISCLSKTGKPRVCFESYREDGRFVLKEIRVQTREFLHACREDGRLKLHFVQPSFDEDIQEEENEEDEDDDDGQFEIV